MEHTKGPWAVARRKGCDWNVVVYKPGTSIEICQVLHDFTKANETGLANAQLLAEAPDMLEALRTISSFAVGNGDVCEIIAKRARAAIAKAEGR